LKKSGEFKISTNWKDEGYDVLIDLALSFAGAGGYLLGTASLYTGYFFLLSMEKGEFQISNKMMLRENGLQTFLLKYLGSGFWATGDDCCINYIANEEGDEEEE